MNCTDNLSNITDREVLVKSKKKKKKKNSLGVSYNTHIFSAQDDRTPEEWAKHEGRWCSGFTVAELIKISLIS